MIHRGDAEDAEKELSPQIKQMSAGNAEVLVGSTEFATRTSPFPAFICLICGDFVLHFLCALRDSAVILHFPG